MPAGLLCALVAALLGGRPSPRRRPRSPSPVPRHGRLLVRLAAGAPDPHRQRPGLDRAQRQAQAGGLRAEQRAPSWRSPADRARRPCRSAEFMAEAIAPALDSRDLLVFDQRGTGSSGPLALPGGGTLQRRVDIAPVRTVRARDRPRAGGFTTRGKRRATSRRCGSPGATKSSSCTAPPTAPRWRSSTPSGTPSTWNRCCSTRSSPVDGPEPFAIPSFQALPGVLRELCCQRGACAGITGDPGRRPRRAERPPAPPRARRLGVRRQRPRATRPGSTRPGCCERSRPGDVNPALRALLPAAVRSALNGDPDPLLRLHVLVRGPDPDAAPRTRRSKAADDVDEALFATTTCEETPVPVVAQRPRGHPAGRSPRLPGGPARQRLLPLRRRTTAYDRRACWKRARRGPTPRRRPPPKARSRTSPR